MLACWPAADLLLAESADRSEVKRFLRTSHGSQARETVSPAQQPDDLTGASPRKMLDLLRGVRREVLRWVCLRWVTLRGDRSKQIIV